MLSQHTIILVSNGGLQDDIILPIFPILEKLSNKYIKEVESDKTLTHNQHKKVLVEHEHEIRKIPS